MKKNISKTSSRKTTSGIVCNFSSKKRDLDEMKKLETRNINLKTLIEQDIDKFKSIIINIKNELEKNYKIDPVLGDCIYFSVALGEVLQSKSGNPFKIRCSYVDNKFLKGKTPYFEIGHCGVIWNELFIDSERIFQSSKLNEINAYLKDPFEGTYFKSISDPNYNEISIKDFESNKVLERLFTEYFPAVRSQREQEAGRRKINICSQIIRKHMKDL